MKKITFFLILFTSNIFLSQELEEFRGVKITDIDSRVMYTDANIAEAMDYLASININAVLVVVLNGGYTQYPSAVMGNLFDGKSIDPEFAGRDPLEKIILEAHRNGIEVYPWFEYGFASFYSGGTAPFGGHILDKYPNWALRTIDGNICTKNGFDWMSAINPDVQDFINSLVIEVIEKYDVDGIEFSDRIPALPVEGGYDSVTVSIYKSEHNGVEPPDNFSDVNWKRWRADKMNQWYHNIREIIKSNSEDIFVASSPSIYPWGYHNYLQDAQTWIDEGIADHFIPQLYRYNLSEYLFELNQAILQTGDKKEILFPGLLLNIGTGSNEYIMSADYLMSAIKANRERGINGEVYFFYEGLRKNNNLIGDLLKSTHYKNPAAIPLRNNNIWRPKAKIVNETDEMASIIGKWDEYKMRGFEGGIFRTNDHAAKKYIGYNFNIEFNANYDLYYYSVPNTNLTDAATYKVYSSIDSTEYVIAQNNMEIKGWQKLESIYLTKGIHKVLTIDNSRVTDEKYLAADAAMLMINRKLSPEVIITDVSDNMAQEEIPRAIQLLQNYPNPFNPTTTIEYTIPFVETEHASMVSIIVYDILGNEIKTLVNKEQPAGVYKIEFDAANLASGIYIYQIKLNDFSDSKKMLLLK
ncbi:MAG: family 10 glycosylhydrolase [Melioribacteraceae bacterium]|nr:family 10 glycosylhydrolase [Melioribacteraceae bacterium]